MAQRKSSCFLLHLVDIFRAARANPSPNVQMLKAPGAGSKDTGRVGSFRPWGWILNDSRLMLDCLKYSFVNMAMAEDVCFFTWQIPDRMWWLMFQYVKETARAPLFRAFKNGSLRHIRFPYLKKSISKLKLRNRKVVKCRAQNQETFPVSCHNQGPYHEIGDRYYQACPNLKAINNIMTRTTGTRRSFSPWQTFSEARLAA